MTRQDFHPTVSRIEHGQSTAIVFIFLNVRKGSVTRRSERQ
jgi:hypothetical protein